MGYSSWHGGPGAWVVTESWTVTLVKTGPVTGSSTLDIKQIGHFAFGSSGSYSNLRELNMGSVTITTSACSLTTPTLIFPIGDILVTSFPGSFGGYPTQSKTQNLGLNYDVNANINVTLAGTQIPDTADTSVLALRNQGQTGVADGVDVQLCYNSTLLWLNAMLNLKQSAGGVETFPLTARYYETKTTVKPGSANATATLNITDQR